MDAKMEDPLDYNLEIEKAEGLTEEAILVGVRQSMEELIHVTQASKEDWRYEDVLRDLETTGKGKKGLPQVSCAASKEVAAPLPKVV
ncbi:hypothetical protein QJS10_CPB04g01702 [Acorus calamus]|uniref:Uncharacterized protein n=1 Tax=Acorus calamus TaxID=4465 RepID=A0AAV9F4D8_ACOCL|nr:hypothetical protein QJS10_CPB04g01702 [Acorus calamus]